MNNIEAEAYDTNLYEERAKLDEINKLKVNIKEIIRKDDIIENVIKPWLSIWFDYKSKFINFNFGNFEIKMAKFYIPS